MYETDWNSPREIGWEAAQNGDSHNPFPVNSSASDEWQEAYDEWQEMHKEAIQEGVKRDR